VQFVGEELIYARACVWCVVCVCVYVCQLHGEVYDVKFGGIYSWLNCTQ
jgi:hypothetical protein